MADIHKVEKLLERSVTARTRGDLEEAIQLGEEAISICDDEVPYGAYLATGIAYAMDGNHRQAQTRFDDAIHVQRTDIAQYFLGSVLACQRDFQGASALFRRNLRIDINESEWTTTEILEIGEPRLEPDGHRPAPFGREVTSSPTDPGLFDFAYLVVCDPVYLRLFAEALTNSLADKSGKDFCIHFHVINPSASDLDFVDSLAGRYDTPVKISTERVIFPSFTDSARKTYYSCARFLAAPDVADWYGCPLVIADIDQLVVKSIDELVDDALQHDVNLIRFDQQQFNLLSLFSASVMIANTTPRARTFLNGVRDYLVDRMRRPSAMTWHLDQAALAVRNLRSTDVDFGYLDPTIMHSSLDGSSDIPAKTVFWSITYSVAANRQKLENKAFQRFIQSDGADATNRFGASGPKVSVVMPVYNGANYMREAIDSALAQTWKNIEIILVDDGSNDDGATREIAMSYGDRIRYIQKENGGVASALNAGIAAMTGDVFCWLSHDDKYAPNKVEQQVRLWKQRGYPDAVLYSDYTLIEADGTKITDVVMDHDMLTEKPVYALFRAAIHGCSIFLPRHLFDEYGVFDVARPTTQDYALWAHMICHVPFIHMPQTLVFSRWHDEQGSKHIDHAEEANKFWSDVLTILPDEEQILLEGTPYQFQKLMGEFLRANNLLAAADNADTLARTVSSDKTVTVIIPVYNRFEMTASALDSVLNQTHQNVEILVVDDGSTEDVAFLVKLIEDRDERVKLIRQANRGPGSARNAGWAKARGEYIAFLDSDDLFMPTKLQIQLEQMDQAGAAISHTSYWLHHGGERLSRVASGAILNGADTFPQIINNCAVATPTVMLRRDLWDEGFRFPEDIRVGEDVVTWISIAAKHQLLGIDEPLSLIRSNNRSAAYDTGSQQIGVLNILSHLSANAEISANQASMDELRRTLVDLMQPATPA